MAKFGFHFMQDKGRFRGIRDFFRLYKGWAKAFHAIESVCFNRKRECEVSTFDPSGDVPNKFWLT